MFDMRALVLTCEFSFAHKQVSDTFDITLLLTYLQQNAQVTATKAQIQARDICVVHNIGVCRDMV